jgi:hypothetical protein
VKIVLTAISLSAVQSRDVMLDMNAKRSETLSQAVIEPSFILSMDIAIRKSALVISDDPHRQDQ